MSATPSRIRRDGRNAFYRGGDPLTHLPYSIADSRAAMWIAGWEQAKADDAIAMGNEEQADLDEEAKIEEFARLYNLAKDRGLIS